MALDDFVSKWTGKPVDFDGVYPNQCMDLVHEYVYEVLGITDKKVLAQPAAYQVFANFDNVVGNGYFDKIANTPSGVPLAGDIVIFNKTASNAFGHICVFLEGDTKGFKSFDANFPTGSLPHVQAHTYGYCLGWLHPKDQAPDIQGQLNACIVDRDSHWNDRQAVADKLKVENNMVVILAELDKLISYEDAVIQKDRQLGDLKKQYDQVQGELEKQKELTDEAQKQVATATIAVADAQKAVDIAEAQRKISQDLADELKKIIQEPILSGWKRRLHDWLLKQ